ncbi:hypothetical protein Dip518_000282 [Parelusimicrobium proximum]|uniref:hypothetical protein n=1 Tax=Parelusimicrobium proximum TaxID=3228953 RepID=UPI003D173848
MRKLFTIITVIALSALHLSAASAKESKFERIIQKDREDIYYGFPSKYISPQTIRFVLPATANRDPYNSITPVYILTQVTEDKVQKYKNSSDKNSLFVLIDINGPLPGYKDFAAFLQDEVILYTELNYHVGREAKYAVFIASEKYAPYMLKMFTQSDDVQNLLLQNVRSFKNIDARPNPNKKGKIFVQAEQYAASHIDSILKASNLAPIKNVLYTFDLTQEINEMPHYFLSGLNEDSYSASVTASSKELILNAEDKIHIIGQLENSKNDFKGNFIIRDIKMSPPYLRFEFLSQELANVKGSEKGSVTVQIDNPVPGKKPIKTKVKIKTAK